MKKKLLLPLMVLSLTLVGCNTPTNSSNSTSPVSDDIVSNDSTNTSSSYSEGEVSHLEQITDVSKLFQTYSKKSDFNFACKYEYSTVYKRQYVETVTSDYQFMNGIIQMTYLNTSENAYHTDYLYENAAENIYKYYLDMGKQKEYQTISGDNQYYAQYVASMDQIDISDIDWKENFLVDTTKKVISPKDDEAKLEIGKHIFGDNAGEYWEKLDISYDNGYITKIDAISIYMERVYYFTVTLSDHTWVNIELPNATQEYIGSKPYYEHETYSGISLNEEQALALQFLNNARDANYSVSTRWELVNNGEVIPTAFIETTTKYADGNAAYTYTNQTTQKTKTDYLVSNKNGSFTLYVVDDNGIRQGYASGTQEYTQNITNFSLDQLNLSGLKASDFVYNAEAGYAMPKNNETEKTLVGNIFGFKDNYYGLHIYFENNAISKVETSLYLVSGDSIASYKKTYTITNIGTTTIEYPSDIQI